MSSSPVTAIVIDSPGGIAALRSRTDTLKVVKLHSKLDRSGTARGPGARAIAIFPLRSKFALFAQRPGGCLQVIVCILRLLAPPSRKVGTRIAGNLAATLPPVSLRLLMYLTRSRPGRPGGRARKDLWAPSAGHASRRPGTLAGD